MKQAIKLALVAIVGMTMMSCMSFNRYSDNGKDDTPSLVTEINKVTTMQPFDQVEIGGAFKIVYEQGTDHNVRVEASEQALKEMTVYVKEGELRIRKAVAKPTEQQSKVKVYVTSPDLKKIGLAGSGMFAASNPISTGNDLNVEIAGSGQVLLAAAACHDTKLEIAGSGDIEIGVLTADNAKAEIAGSGDINLGKVTCKALTAEIAGSGNVNCENIKADKAHADIAGSGDVNLKGSVQNITKNIAGSGKVNLVEAKPTDSIK